MSNDNKYISVLGGGPSGLATIWEAQNQGLKARLFEASGRIGGNCITLEHNGFLYDSGAHRLHDKDPETIALAESLLGRDLLKINVPSQIFIDDQFIDFPLSPFNLLKGIGITTFTKASVQLLTQKLISVAKPDNFRDLALRTYGNTIAEMFLLGYTEKLWGSTPELLSTDVAGNRLKGLNLVTFLIELFRGKKQKTAHLDGSFYYPRFGIGSFFEAMQQRINDDALNLHSAVTGMNCEHNRIVSIEINKTNTIPVETVVSSLPLNALLRALNPAPPKHILDLSASIRFRNIVLIGFFLNKATINKNGSMYFPSKKYPFTRIYEPRNRSATMSPEGQTSLMVEIPCQEGDEWWIKNETALIQSVQKDLIEAGFFSEVHILDVAIHRIHHAYPILEKDYQEKIKPIQAYLSQFDNLYLTGRNGLFAYSHIHDHMVNGRAIIKDMLANNREG